MITYTDAKAKALFINKRINACKEFNLAYHFYCKNDQKERTLDNDIVILKETGKIINFSTFILDYHPEKNPREIAF